MNNYSQEFQEMRNNSTIFLAIKSINITHMLIAYFYLNKDEVSVDAKRVRAKRKQFKRFC